MSYVVGIDGGGSKTTCQFSPVDRPSVSSDSPVWRVTGKGTNPQIVGYQEMKLRLKEIIAEGMETFSIDPADISAVCFGLAGVRQGHDVNNTMKKAREIFEELKFNENTVHFICSDAYIALRGALDPNAKEGILVVSGTGSNAIGLSKRSDIFSSGGWGCLLGDEGSGYRIALDALQSVCRAYDRRGKRTMLTEMVLDALELKDVQDLVSLSYEQDTEKLDIARLAKEVIRASEEQDEVAIEILKNAATELALHVRSLFRQCADFHEQTPVTTAGSIFHHSDIVRTQFIDYIKTHDLGCYQAPYSDPVSGAVLVAGEALRNRFAPFL